MGGTHTPKTKTKRTRRGAGVDHVAAHQGVVLLLLLPLASLAHLRGRQQDVAQQRLRGEAGGLILQDQGAGEDERVRVQVRPRG